MPDDTNVASPIRVSAYVLVGREEHRIASFLQHVAAWFDEFVFVFDTECLDDSASIVGEHVARQKKIDPLFTEDKYRKYHRALGNDFSAQSNYAASRCTFAWRMRLDVDERYPRPLLESVRSLIAYVERAHPRVSAIGFPRLNFLDEKISNDIPNSKIFTSKFHEFPDRPAKVRNLDVQYRLHRQDQKWALPVHEMLSAVVANEHERVFVARSFFIEHRKTRTRQRVQDKKYREIANAHWARTAPTEVHK